MNRQKMLLGTVDAVQIVSELLGVPAVLLTAGLPSKVTLHAQQLFKLDVLLTAMMK